MMSVDPKGSATLFHVDPYPVWREGFAQALQGAEFRLVGAAADGREALEALRNTPADLVVSEVEPYGMSGFDLFDRLKSEGFRGRFIFLTGDLSPALKAKAQRAGAAATLAKGVDEEDLLKTLTRIRTGKSAWRKRDLSNEPEPSLATHRLSLLTSRERETLELLTRGMTNRQIADQLKISYETVKEHVQHILRKLPADDRTQAAIWAVRNGLN